MGKEMKNVSFEMMHSSLWETRRQVCREEGISFGDAASSFRGSEGGNFFRANLCHFLFPLLPIWRQPHLILVSLRALSPFPRSGKGARKSSHTGVTLSLIWEPTSYCKFKRE